MTTTDLRELLETFVDNHRGLRFAKMFGKPAAFAGRRAFAYVDSGRIAIKRSGRWIVHRPHTAIEARKLIPLLEVAAREVAETYGT